MGNIEIWKDVVGYEGLYQVSDLGNVKRIIRFSLTVGKYKSIIKERVLKKNKNRLGYIRIGMSKNLIRTYFSIHRLVAIAFIPNPENKPQVNHINGIKSDNRLDNLEWCTASENQIHSHKIGLAPSKKGEGNQQAKLNKKQVLEIRKSSLKQKELSIMYNISISHINAIIIITRWTHI